MIGGGTARFISPTLPLGRLQNVVYHLQDHFEVLEFLRGGQQAAPPAPARRLRPSIGRGLLAEAGPLVKPLPEEGRMSGCGILPTTRLSSTRCNGPFEWGDLELLLRTVRELGLDPLLLSMPIEYEHFERMGIAPQSIDAYAWQLHDFAARYQVPVADFVDFSDDPRFFADHFGHPSALGWVYLDRALDDFFHGRPLRERKQDLPADTR